MFTKLWFMAAALLSKFHDQKTPHSRRLIFISFIKKLIICQRLISLIVIVRVIEGMFLFLHRSFITMWVEFMDLYLRRILPHLN